MSFHGGSPSQRWARASSPFGASTSRRYCAPIVSNQVVGSSMPSVRRASISKLPFCMTKTASSGTASKMDDSWETAVCFEAVVWGWFKVTVYVCGEAVEVPSDHTSEITRSRNSGWYHGIGLVSVSNAMILACLIVSHVTSIPFAWSFLDSHRWGREGSPCASLSCGCTTYTQCSAALP